MIPSHGASVDSLESRGLEGVIVVQDLPSPSLQKGHLPIPRWAEGTARSAHRKAGRDPLFRGSRLVSWHAGHRNRFPGLTSLLQRVCGVDSCGVVALELVKWRQVFLTSHVIRRNMQKRIWRQEG